MEEKQEKYDHARENHKKRELMRDSGNDEDGLWACEWSSRVH
jgi:hypothetical protein